MFEDNEKSVIMRIEPSLLRRRWSLERSVDGGEEARRLNGVLQYGLWWRGVLGRKRRRRRREREKKKERKKEKERKRKTEKEIINQTKQENIMVAVKTRHAELNYLWRELEADFFQSCFFHSN
jgi:hypothetical protein